MDTPTFNESHPAAPSLTPVQAAFTLRESDAASVAQAVVYGQMGPVALSRLVTGIAYGLTAAGLFSWGIGLFASQMALQIGLIQLARRRYRRATWHEQTTWTFSTEGVEVKGFFSLRQFDWSAFKRVVESSHVFMLYPQKSHYHVIPKRAFAGAGTLERFREIVRQQGLRYVTLYRPEPETSAA